MQARPDLALVAEAGPFRLRRDLHVLRIALGCYLHALNRTWSAPEATPGKDTELDRLLAGVGVEVRPSPDDHAAVDTLLARDEQRAADTDRSGPRLPGPYDPLACLVHCLDLDPGRELLVAAAWWAEVDPQFGVVLGCGHDDVAQRYASARLLRLVLAPFGVAIPLSVDDNDPLVRAGVLRPGSGSVGPLGLSPVARLLLAGEFPAVCTPPRGAPQPLPARLRDAARGIAAAMAEGGPVLVSGPPGAGRRLACQAAIGAAGRIMLADPVDPSGLKLLARISGAVPVARLHEVDLDDWTGDDGPLLLIAEPAERSDGLPAIDVPGPDYQERVDGWSVALTGAGVLAEDAGEMSGALADRTGLSAVAADRVARHARAAAGGPPAIEDIWRALPIREPAAGGLVRVTLPARSLDDLVLAPDTRAHLEELISAVKLRYIVEQRWSIRSGPRGRGVAALFAGLPGTGKTTAGEAVAGALGLQLHRVDLACVVSKYIGETEKNLAAVFDAAQHAHAVLFFDEADALFGKRTEVRDAHDRYANLEVAYLLQRVEECSGLTILATNRRSAIDEAFLRRLRFVVRFESPGPPQRLALWERELPARVRHEDLDVERLAGLELSGGGIHNAAQAAAYLAAADGGVVRAAHVERALHREFDKLARTWPGLSRGEKP